MGKLAIAAAALALASCSVLKDRPILHKLLEKDAGVVINVYAGCNCRCEVPPAK